MPILNTGLVEGAQRFTVGLSNPSGEAAFGPIANAMVTITENDVGAQFVFYTYSVAEDAGAATLAGFEATTANCPSPWTSRPPMSARSAA